MSLAGIFRPPPELPAPFWERTNRVLRRRVRVACILGLLFRPLILIGYVAGSVSAPAFLAVEGALFALFLFGTWSLGREWSERYLATILYGGIGVASFLICLGLFTIESTSDPAYHVFILRNTIVILATGLFFPWPGLWILGLGAIPLGIQTGFSLFWEIAPQLPILLSSAASLLIAAAGGQVGFDLEARSFFASERLQTLSQRRRDYLQHLLEEIQEPVGSLLDLAEQLGRSRSIDEVERLSWEIEGRARHAYGSMRNLLTVTLLEEHAGDLGKQPARSDVVAACTAVIDEGLAPAALRRVRLDSRVPEELAVAVDRRDLERVLSNLVEIAFERVADGGRVTLSASAGDEEDVDVALEAAPATGLLDEEATILFEEGESVRWDAGGVGVSLFIVREIVHAYGGRVQAPDGEALRLVVRLPAMGKEGSQ